MLTATKLKLDFKIKSVIDCLTRNVIYLINDNICKISSVGYTADNMKTRFANHKSHIKFNKRLNVKCLNILQII